jgi:RHS repeat-associated protein
MDQTTESIQGQMESGSSPWSFNQLTPFNSQQRTFEVYVHFSAAPGSGWQNYSVSDGHGTPSFTPKSGVTATVGGWYDLGTVTVAAGDSSTSVTLTDNSSTLPDEVSLTYNYGDYPTYDAAGELSQEIDRDGRSTVYQYDGVGRETGETWYSSQQIVTETISNVYNAAGLLQSASDQPTGASAATDSYTYYNDGTVHTDTQSVPGLTPSVVLTENYTTGNRTQVAAAIGGTNDFVNNYQYQGLLGQMSQVTQTQQTGGNTVLAKAVNFSYDNVGEFSTILRYADLGEQKPVAAAAYSYDNDGNLTSLAYTNGGSTLPSYSWTYDALGNMASATNNTDGTVNYTNDSTGQILTATGGQSYSYDANGNRTNSGYQTGQNNELLSDGTYTYAYDANGNRTSRTASDGSQIQYGWDNRNRLISVTFKNSGGATTQTVTYIYDASNRWVGETITAGSTTTQARYVYDGNQIVLEFDGTGSGSLTATSPSHRYLWGAAVDQLMADEQVSNGDLLAWTLGDNENTVRDIATYNGSVTTVANHRVFSAYGQLLSQTNSSVGCLIAYTGRPLDQATGLQNNLNRWYDAIVGRWLSQDPSGFGGGDANLYRYCGNGPTTLTDPSGMATYVLDPFHVTNGIDPSGLDANAEALAELEFLYAQALAWNRNVNPGFFHVPAYLNDSYNDQFNNDCDHQSAELLSYLQSLPKPKYWDLQPMYGQKGPYEALWPWSHENAVWLMAIRREGNDMPDMVFDMFKWTKGGKFAGKRTKDDFTKQYPYEANCVSGGPALRWDHKPVPPRKYMTPQSPGSMGGGVY